MNSPCTIVFLLCLRFLSVTAGSWWLLAMPSAYHLTNFKSDYKNECHSMKYLTARQRELCSLSENMLAVVSQGAQMGLRECQNQFSGRHWNCSTQFDYAVPHLMKKPLPRINRTTPTVRSLNLQADAPAVQDVGEVFGGILKFHSREKAYVHAISAAGVAYSITRACSTGKLPSCGCDRNVHLKRRSKGRWEWGGCSEDISYGERLSTDFIDSNDLAKEWGDPSPKLMNLHNNEAGRRAIRKNMQLMCKCHGVSGSCTTKICWRKMRDFSSVGESLYRKFDGAVRVKFSSKRHKLKPAMRGHKKPRKRDLVYLEESPDYCRENKKYGIFGTSGRSCKVDSYVVDNCRLLCCGRGYKTVVLERNRDCNCKFVWCCEVRCQICRERVEQHYCR